jgi:hypothetical protein
MYLSRYVFYNQVVVLKFREPSGDSPIDGFWCFPIGEVCVVCEYGYWVFRGCKVGSPVRQGFDDGQ